MDVAIIHGSKNSDSLKALVGTAHGGKAVWATVSTSGGSNDRVTYRTPGYGRGKNGAVPFDEITWVQRIYLKAGEIRYGCTFDTRKRQLNQTIIGRMMCESRSLPMCIVAK